MALYPEPMAIESVGLAGPLAPERTAPALTRAERRRQTSGRPAEAVMPLAIAAVTLVLRLLTAAVGPTDWDSAQYASAINHYDVTQGQPQPPGYWLYVASGRFLHEIVGMGAIAGLVLVAALASAAAAGMTAVAGKDLGGWWIGLAAGAVVATSPFAWFSGSTVSTYSFDMLACSSLMVLAWRARPGSWHGLGAVVAFGLLAGFRQSIVQSFALLTLIAVIGSTRRLGRLAITLLAGAAAVAIWLVPMALEQPGGIAAWTRATWQEATGAARITSVLDHAPGGATNLGTVTGYTVVALAPLALLSLAAGVALLVRRLARGPAERSPDPMAAPRVVGGNFRVLPRWTRPWYQGRVAVLGAAIVPPVLIVSLVQFAKGGYLLAYLPAATIALLLPLGALVGALGRRPGRSYRMSRPWMVISSLAVVAVVALGAQRFLAGGGVLPDQWVRSAGPVWLVQPRYQAPYLDTRAAIRSADSIDAALAAMAATVDAGRDVVVFDNLDGGQNLYRDAGWALPGSHIALIGPGAIVYNELHGSLYYASGRAVAVGPGGSALLVAPPALPGLDQLAARGRHYRCQPRVRSATTASGASHLERASSGSRSSSRRAEVRWAVGSDRTGTGRGDGYDEVGVALDDPRPAEPPVHVGTPPGPEAAGGPVVAGQQVHDDLELPESRERQATAGAKAVLDRGPAGPVHHHRRPGAPRLGHRQRERLVWGG